MAGYLGALAPYLGVAAEAAAAREEQRRQRSAPRGLAGIDMFRDPGMVAPYLAAAQQGGGPGPFPLGLDTGNPPSLLDLIQAANPTRDPRQAMAPGQQGRDPGMLAPYVGPPQRGGPQSMAPGYQAAQPGHPQTNDPGYGASRAMVDDPTYNPSMAMIDDPAYDPSAPPYATSLAAAGAPGGSAGPGSVPGQQVPGETDVEGLPWNPAEVNVEDLPWLTQGNAPPYATPPLIQDLINELTGDGNAESDKWGALGQGFAAMAESPFFLSGVAKGAGTALDKMSEAKDAATKRKIAGAGLMQGETRMGEDKRSAMERERQGERRIDLEGQSLAERERNNRATLEETRRGRALTAEANRALAQYRMDSLDVQREGQVPDKLKIARALIDDYDFAPQAAILAATNGAGGDASVFAERFATAKALGASDDELLQLSLGGGTMTPYDKERLRLKVMEMGANMYPLEPALGQKWAAEQLERYKQMFDGGAPAPTTPPPGGEGTPAPGAAPGAGTAAPDQGAVIERAKRALAAGKDPAAVRALVKSLGVNPNVLDE